MSALSPACGAAVKGASSWFGGFRRGTDRALPDQLQERVGHGDEGRHAARYWPGTKSAAGLSELKRRDGIRESGRRVRRPVAPATRRWPVRPASDGGPDVAVVGQGFCVVVRCCSGAGTRSAPGTTGGRSRSKFKTKN